MAKKKIVRSSGGSGSKKTAAARKAALAGKSSSSPKAAASAKPKISRTRRPPDLSLEQWQIALRREFGESQDFRLENLGDAPVFSEFAVDNPATGGRYRVAIRGESPGVNYCSCPDFAVNTLGTCKHIEFTLSRLRRAPGAGEVLKAGHRSSYSSISLRYGMQRRVMFKAGLDCPPGFRTLAAKYFDLEGELRSESFGRFDEFLRKARRTGGELRCYEDAVGYIARVRDQARLRESVDRAFAEGKASGWRGLLKERLYPYQQAGALFAARAGRSIIADEMGLGKTVQAIAACEVLARVAGAGKVMVICPASLKHQWQDEIGRFAGREALTVEGPAAARAAHWERESFYKIVNYEMISRDSEQIRRWSPDVIVLDEAQRIKNWKTMTAQAVKRLDSPHAIVLTGTPLENRLEELHSIIEFVDRFQLGPRFRFLDRHQVTDDAGMVVGYKDLTSVARTLSPILIRRTKREVMGELPERLEKKYFVEMTPQQRALHEENRETVARIVAKWRRLHFLSETDQRVLMTSLQNMRMSCNSTYLLDRRTDHGRKTGELMLLLEDLFQDPETKAVVFSQWLGTHELIVRRLQDRGWGHAFLHGGVPSPQRRGLIQRFRDDPSCRLFLSTEAGGVGLNLQNASVVVNMDLPWNPATLEQRIGRVHRLGQRRPVQVVNFIASGTIEHGMLSLLGFKRSLFAGVLDGGEDEVFLGGSRLKRFMESVERASGSIPPPPPPEETAPRGAREAGEAEGEPAQKQAGASVAAPWAEVASAGLVLLEKISQALTESSTPPAGKPTAAGAPGPDQAPWIERDQAGRAYFKLPLPGPEGLRKIADLLCHLGGSGGGGE